MTTFIIAGVIIAVILIACARIMKWWRAPIVEENRTERRKAWFEFRKWLREKRWGGK